jgi:membrane-associated HD superfamily phosphohydrolase
MDPSYPPPNPSKDRS